MTGLLPLQAFLKAQKKINTTEQVVSCIGPIPLLRVSAVLKSDAFTLDTFCQRSLGTNAWIASYLACLPEMLEEGPQK